MEPEGSLPCLQQPAKGPYPEPDESNPQPPNLFAKDPFEYYPPTFPPRLPSGLFPSGYPTKTLYAFRLAPMRATRSVQHAVLDLIILIIFSEEYNQSVDRQNR
jgi:hypothetical protein